MRYRLKCGGKPRRKAFAGADGAIMAAATLAASAANVAAQSRSASTQAKAMEDNAKAQAKAIERQTNNINQLQQEYILFFSCNLYRLCRTVRMEVWSCFHMDWSGKCIYRKFNGLGCSGQKNQNYDSAPGCGHHAGFLRQAVRLQSSEDCRSGHHLYLPDSIYCVCI